MFDSSHTSVFCDLPPCPEKSHPVFCGPDRVSHYGSTGILAHTFCSFSVFKQLYCDILIPFTQSMNFIRRIQLCSHDRHEILEQIHHPLCPLGGSVPTSSPGLRQEQSASCFCRFVFSGNFL